MALRRVFIYFGVVFLMSYIIFSNKVSAISTNLSFDDIIVKGSSLTPTIECSINGSSAIVQYSWCYSSSSGSNLLNNIHTTAYFDVEKNDYIEFDLVIRTLDSFSSGGGYFLEDVNNFAPSGFRLVDRQQIIDTTLYSNIFSVTNGTGENLVNGNYLFHAYRYVFRYVGDGSSVQLGLNQQSASRGFVRYSGQLYFRLANVVVYEGITSSQSQDQKNEINETNNAVEDSQNAGDSSQSDTDNTTQSLMTAGANIIGALTSAPATDCNINVSTTGNSSSFTGAIGSLNLCSDVPSSVLTLVQGMVALVFTPLVLYYVYHILTLIYAQFKEYNS